MPIDRNANWTKRGAFTVVNWTSLPPNANIISSHLVYKKERNRLSNSTHRSMGPQGRWYKWLQCQHAMLQPRDISIFALNCNRKKGRRARWTSRRLTSKRGILAAASTSDHHVNKKHHQVPFGNSPLPPMVWPTAGGYGTLPPTTRLQPLTDFAHWNLSLPYNFWRPTTNWTFCS